jgi:hypothetical protein
VTAPGGYFGNPITAFTTVLGNIQSHNWNGVGDPSPTVPSGATAGYFVVAVIGAAEFQTLITNRVIFQTFGLSRGSIGGTIPPGQGGPSWAGIFILAEEGEEVRFIMQQAEGGTQEVLRLTDTEIHLQAQRNRISSGFLTLPNVGSPLVISGGGAVTAFQSYHVVDTAGAAPADNLDTILGGVTGDLLMLRSGTVARKVTVRDGVGNISLAGSVDFLLNSTLDRLLLMAQGGTWVEVSRSANT